MFIWPILAWVFPVALLNNDHRVTGVQFTGPSRPCETRRAVVLTIVKRSPAPVQSLCSDSHIDEALFDLWLADGNFIVDCVAHDLTSEMEILWELHWEDFCFEVRTGSNRILPQMKHGNCGPGNKKFTT